jgi:O-antigen/teichoic acid export membrane protein
MTNTSDPGEKAQGMGRRTGLFFLARAVSAAASLITIAITTRLLVPEELGQCNLAFSAAALGNALLFTWVGFVVWRYYPEAVQKRGERVFLRWLTRAGGICAAGWALYWLGAMLVMGESSLIVKLLILPLGLMMGAGEIIQAVLQIQGRVRQSVILSMASAGALVLVNTAVLFSGWQSAAAYLLASAAVYAVSALRGAYLCRVHETDTAEVNWLRPREMIGFGLPQTLIAICALLLTVGDRFLINVFAGPAGVAVYHAASTLGDLAVQIPVTALTQAAVPLIIAAWEREGRECAAAEMRKAMRLMYQLVLPVTCLAMAVGPVAGMILLGQKYHQALVYLPAVCFGSWFFGMTKILNIPFQLEKRPYPLIWLLAVAAAVKLIVNLIFLPVMGTRGAMIATLIAFAAYFLFSLMTVRKLLPCITGMAVPCGFMEWITAAVCGVYGVASVCSNFERVGTFHFIAAAGCLAVSVALLLPRAARLLQLRKGAAAARA